MDAWALVCPFLRHAANTGRSRQRLPTGHFRLTGDQEPHPGRGSRGRVANQSTCRTARQPPSTASSMCHCSPIDVTTRSATRRVLAGIQQASRADPERWYVPVVDPAPRPTRRKLTGAGSAPGPLWRNRMLERFCGPFRSFRRVGASVLFLRVPACGAALAACVGRVDSAEP